MLLVRQTRNVRKLKMHELFMAKSGKKHDGLHASVENW